MRPTLGLIGWLVLTYAAALVGAQFMPGEWYAALRKPSWTPPSWLFAPVWTALYAAMAVAAWLVWRKGAPLSALPLGLYVAQLAANAVWSWLFFGLHRPGLALADIIVLWVLIAACVVVFRRVSVPASVLMIPYLAWVTFATALNGALWAMNRSA